MALPEVITRPDGSLYCDVSIESLGFPSYTPLCSIPIQYDGDKFREMGQLFVGYARSTCPVDTGYLRDHNDFSADAGGIEMWSEAFYSAYQEYGTSRCRAQPWFESSILSALADSGIEDSFSDTQTRFNYIDGELSAIQSATPMSIAECWSLIDRIEALQEELASVGVFVEGLEESIDEIENQIEMMMMEMMMAQATGQVMELTFLEELIISFIAGAIGVMIRAIIDNMFDNKDNDANPHNPSH